MNYFSAFTRLEVYHISWSHPLGYSSKWDTLVHYAFTVYTLIETPQPNFGKFCIRSAFACVWLHSFCVRFTFSCVRFALGCVRFEFGCFRFVFICVCLVFVMR